MMIKSHKEPDANIWIDKLTFNGGYHIWVHPYSISTTLDPLERVSNNVVKRGQVEGLLGLSGHPLQRNVFKRGEHLKAMLLSFV